MPMLELPADTLDRPMVGVRPYLAALMLHPNDDAKQTRLRCLLMSDEIIDKAERGQFDGSPLADDLVVFADYTTALVDRDKIDDAARRRYIHGLVAGRILIEALGRFEAVPEISSLTAIKQEIAGALSRHRISVKTMDNTIWTDGTFKPVAPFWAAYWTLGDSTGRLGPVPCRLADLSLFLGTAERYRQKAEATRLKQADGPLLTPGTTWVVPREIRAPGVDWAVTIDIEGAAKLLGHER